MRSKSAAFNPEIKRTGPARLVLALYHHRHWRTGRCDPGIETLAHETLLKDRKSVRRARRVCVKKGAVTEVRYRKNGKWQGSNQHVLAKESLPKLVCRVAEGPLAIYAAMLGRLVFVTGTVEATARDLASDSGVQVWRVDTHLQNLERLGYIRRSGENLWALGGFERGSSSPHKCAPPPQRCAPRTTLKVRDQLKWKTTPLRGSSTKSYASPCDAAPLDAGEGEPHEVDLDELRDEAEADGDLLGWLDHEWHHERTFSEEFLAEVADDPDDLFDEVAVEMSRRAAPCPLQGIELRGRCNPAMLTPAGLFALRSLAAMRMALTDEDGASALAFVLDGIEKRIGRKRERLSSFKLIGQRILGASRRGRSDRLYAGGRVSAATDALSQWIAEFKEMDGANLISPDCYRNLGGLRRLRAAHGDRAREVIRARLIGAQIDGSEIAKVTTWAYFGDGLDDERVREAMAAAGIKIGDVYGAHRN